MEELKKKIDHHYMKDLSCCAIFAKKKQKSIFFTICEFLRINELAYHRFGDESDSLFLVGKHYLEQTYFVETCLDAAEWPTHLLRNFFFWQSAISYDSTEHHLVFLKNSIDVSQSQVMFSKALESLKDSFSSYWLFYVKWPGCFVKSSPTKIKSRCRNFVSKNCSFSTIPALVPIK